MWKNKKKVSVKTAKDAKQTKCHKNIHKWRTKEIEKLFYFNFNPILWLNLCFNVLTIVEMCAHNGTMLVSDLRLVWDVISVVQKLSLTMTVWNIFASTGRRFLCDFNGFSVSNQNNGIEHCRICDENQEQFKMLLNICTTLQAVCALALLLQSNFSFLCMCLCALHLVLVGFPFFYLASAVCVVLSMKWQRNV